MKKLKNLIKIFIFFGIKNFFLYLILFKLQFKKKRNKFDNINQIIFNHFLDNINDHINKTSFIKTFKLLNLVKNPIIVETGSSAWGLDSTKLLDSYVNSFEGKLLTCDIRIEPAFYLRKYLSKNTNFYHMDSLKFLNDLKKKKLKCDLIYLDSLDLDFDNFQSSIDHGFKEFLIASKLIKKNGIILIDDTPRNLLIIKKVWGSLNYEKSKLFLIKNKYLPGKGSLVRTFVKKNKNFKIILNEYQLLIQKK
jgi:hypothetical protein